MLPGVSGFEICRRLRARDATRDLPVIMLTARGEESERVRGLSIGADDPDKVDSKTGEDEACGHNDGAVIASRREDFHPTANQAGVQARHANVS